MVLAHSIPVLVALALHAPLAPPQADAKVPAVLEASTGAPAALAAAADALVPRSNEAMEYSVSYLGIPMGKARLFVGRVDPGVAPVFLQAETSSILAFIKLRQQLATYLDVATGLPRSASLDAVEGSYRHSDTVQFDRDANKATVRERGKYDNTYLVDVPEGALDFVGLVFKLRGLTLEPGGRHEFPVLSGRRVNTIAVDVLERETVATKLGDVATIKVRVPTGFSGKFSEKNPTCVWFSDDERRIVVRISTDFAIGHATASLVSYTPGEPPAAVITER